MHAQVVLSARVPDITVSLGKFDVDDPSWAVAPVDNESRPTDNRGQNVPLLRDTAPTNSAGIALFENIYTSLRPGDNFRLVGSIRLGFHVEEDVAVKQAEPTAGVYFSNWQPIPSADDTVVKSPLLTVYRQIHVELDHMEGPPAGEFFAGPGEHEDINPGGPIPDLLLDLTAMVCRDVFIDVVNDLGSQNTRPTVPWRHNATLLDEAFLFANRDVRGSADYWVAHAVAAYESDVTSSFDPNVLGTAHMGSQKENGDFVVYTEVVRDYLAAQGMGEADQVSWGIQMATVHELTHAWGLIHQSPLGDEGPLNGDNMDNVIAQYEYLGIWLTDGQQNHIRSYVGALQ